MFISLLNNFSNIFGKKTRNNLTSPNLEYNSYGINDKTDKQLRINILLEIKNIKNTYYKYINNSKYSDKLYNNILQETEYEDGILVSDNSIVYDNDIKKYINCRKELFENTKRRYIIKKNLQDFYMINDGNENNILYIIDLEERDMFNYCYDYIKRDDKNLVRDLLFTVIINNVKKIERYVIVKDYEKLKLVL